MAAFTADFESGVDGATITTNANEASATAWVAQGGAAIYSATHAAHGSLSMKSSADGDWLQWNIASPTDYYCRAYVYMGAYPGGSMYFWYADACRLYIGTDGKVRLFDTTGIVDSTNSISLNQWVRIEWHIVVHASTGVFECKFFNSADSTTPTETFGGTANRNTGTAPPSTVFGPGGTPPTGGLWLDDLVVNATAYPGPVTGNLCTADFEAGVDGATITTSGAEASATAWDSIVLALAPLTYDDTHAAQGSLSAHLEGTGGSGGPSMRWTTALGTPTNYYFRTYLYVTATGFKAEVFEGYLGGSHAWRLDMQTDNHLAIWDLAFSGPTIVSTNAVNLNAWTRIEGHVDHAASYFEYRLFLNPDSTTPTETKSITSGVGYLAGIDEVRMALGSLSPAAVWYDGVAMGAETWLGPDLPAQRLVPRRAIGLGRW